MENKQRRDTVQNFGLWRKKLSLLRTAGQVPTGAFSQKTCRERAAFQNHQEGKDIKPYEGNVHLLHPCPCSARKKIGEFPPHKVVRDSRLTAMTEK